MACHLQIRGLRKCSFILLTKCLKSVANASPFRKGLPWAAKCLYLETTPLGGAPFKVGPKVLVLPSPYQAMKTPEPGEKLLDRFRRQVLTLNVWLNLQIRQNLLPLPSLIVSSVIKCPLPPSSSSPYPRYRETSEQPEKEMVIWRISGLMSVK